MIGSALVGVCCVVHLDVSVSEEDVGPDPSRLVDRHDELLTTHEAHLV